MILFRDILSRGGVRLPPFLEGCPGVSRTETKGGDILTTGDPLFLQEPPDRAWKDIDDGWQVCLIGDPELAKHRRQRSDIKVSTVKDPNDQEWTVPLVLDVDNNCLLAMPWGRENGVRVRAPTDEQKRLISAAEAARHDIQTNKLTAVPLDVLGEWVYAMLESVYHLNADVIDALGLMSDELACWILLTATGLAHVEV